MQVTVKGIKLNLLKTAGDWAVYPGDSQSPFLMQWNGADWCFVSKETPTDLKAIEDYISLYIEMQDE